MQINGIVIPSEVICALIAALGAAVSAFISWHIAKATANNAIEQLKLTWAREDVVSSDSEFAELASAVAEYVQLQLPGIHRTAIQKVAAARIKEPGELSTLLDQLYTALEEQQPGKADRLLTQVIEVKRKARHR